MTAPALLGLATAGGLAWLASRAMTPDPIDMDQAKPMPPDAGPIATLPITDRNVRAVLAMIRAAEGTSGPNGYRMLFGGQLFASFADHPRQRITRTSNGRQITSTAAGAYQVLARTWDSYRGALGLFDFTPDSQDRFAVELIRRRGGLEHARAGRIAELVPLIAKEWASLPGAGYGQPERSGAYLLAAFRQAGGRDAV